MLKIFALHETKKIILCLELSICLRLIILTYLFLELTHFQENIKN